METERPSRWTEVALCVLLAGCASPYGAQLAQEREAQTFHSVRRAPDTARPAAPELPPVPELDAYVRYGLAQNAALRAAFAEWRAALERVTAAGALPDPRFTYGEFIEEVETRTGPQERRFGLSQGVPWPGRLRTAESVAERHAEMLWQSVAQERLDVIEAVEVAFFEYSFLATNARITGEVLDLLQRLEPVVQARIQSGGKQEDLLRLQVEIGRLENDLAGLEKLAPSLAARLAAAMNHPDPARLTSPALTEPDVKPVDTEALYARALATSPRLLGLEEAVRRSANALDLAGFAARPDLTLGVDYFETGDAVAPGTSGSGDDPVAVTLSLNLPVWTGRNTAVRRAAEHELRAAQDRIDDARAVLRADLEAAAYRLDDAARQIALYRDSLIPRARETLELTLASYRAGDATLLDLIDSERSQLAFEIAYWRACRDYRQSRARLGTLVGGVQ